MKTIQREPLLQKHQWAVPGLILAFSLYGLLSFVCQRILSTMIMKNMIGMGTYQNITRNISLTIGILTSAALTVLFLAAAMGSSGIRRAGFIAGLFSALGPIFGVFSTAILFRTLKLPSMGAGSVIAAALSALLIIVPCFIMFILFAFCRKLKGSSRLLALLIAVLSLLVAFYPTAIAVLALVVMPGNPAMTPYMNLAGYMIHVRPLFIALGLCFVHVFNKEKRQTSGKHTQEFDGNVGG